MDCIRKGKYADAETFLEKALEIDTYDGEANFLMGIIAQKEPGDMQSVASKQGSKKGHCTH